MGRTLIRGARQVLTLRGAAGSRRGPALRQLQIIEDGSVLIENGRIRDVGPTRRVENLQAARHAREVPAFGRVIMPGFADPQVHLLTGPAQLDVFEEDLLRLADSVSPLLRTARGALQAVKAVRFAGARRLQIDLAATLRGFLRYGTTTVGAASGFSMDEAGELKVLRVYASLSDFPIDLVSVCYGAHLLPPEFSGTAEEYLGWVMSELIPQVRQRGLAQAMAVCCEDGAFSASQLRPTLEAARATAWPVHVHTGRYGPSSGVELAVETGARSCIHANHLTPDQIERLAQSEVVAVLTPAAAFQHGEPPPPARALIDSGAALALGTGFSRWAQPTYSMPLNLSLACRQLRLTPAEAITAATINAAHVLDRDPLVGSIEPGKDANLLMLATGDYRDLIYEAGHNPVEQTFVRGEPVFADAPLTPAALYNAR
jgi:imidazolonepropionase